MAKKELPPLDLLRQLIRYDSETGKLYWLPRHPDLFDCVGHSKEHNCAKWNKKNAGKEAGTVSESYKYIYLRINKKNLLAHRIAYALHHNIQLSPEIGIDHINGIKKDNSSKNLRVATPSQQAMNTKINSKNRSGVRGVSWDGRRKKWFVFIKINQTMINLGRYVNLIDAIKIRKNAEEKYFGDYARK